MNDQIQRALEIMASRGSDPGAATVWQNAFEGVADERAHRRRVRHRSITSAIAAVSVIVIVLALVALTKKSARRPTLSVTPTSIDHTSAPGVAAATASQLVGGQWSTLPLAPVPTRARATVVWTGHELIVWGGATGRNQDQLRADGAAYDPATNAWHVLPAAPLSARLGQAAVWTGTEMIVWGGYDDASSTNLHATNDGAAYNPRTNSWNRLPESPLAPRTQAIAVWTGNDLVVLGGQPAIVTDARPEFTDGAAYDPASNRWHLLAVPVPLAHHPLTWVAAVQAGPTQLLAWSQWSLSRSTGPGSAQLSGGADLFRLDEATGLWTDVTTAANALPSVNEVIWTGEHTVVRGIPYNCGVCAGPFVAEATALYDPGTNSWKRLPPDPLGSNEMTSAWTGAALFSFNPGAQIGPIGPGDATVYDPTTNRWSRLQRAPFGCDGSTSPIWTGEHVLLYCPHSSAASGGSSSGLVYTPAH